MGARVDNLSSPAAQLLGCLFKDRERAWLQGGKMRGGTREKEERSRRRSGEGKGKADTLGDIIEGPSEGRQ